MAIVYKIDVLKELKARGYNTSRLRKDKIMGEATIQKIREKQLASWATIDTICKLLGCDVGDIVEYVKNAGEGVQ
ncbi:MAG: helix-turn-helix transcriptional regulator [Clostridia bacterium]|nr:helix-turn-helix transcriptional regulator [Clostridia bacterium]